ncbi:MAG TPA: hypothetical protein VE690_11665 [Rhodopila sp.]|nr:hypothetical protein [Rhodopila sp.]
MNDVAALQADRSLLLVRHGADRRASDAELVLSWTNVLPPLAGRICRERDRQVAEAGATERRAEMRPSWFGGRNI